MVPPELELDDDPALDEAPELDGALAWELDDAAEWDELAPDVALDPELDREADGALELDPDPGVDASPLGVPPDDPELQPTRRTAASPSCRHDAMVRTVTRGRQAVNLRARNRPVGENAMRVPSSNG